MKTVTFIGGGIANPDVARIAELVPVWLEAEAEYADSKYGDKNPQLTALYGGLQSGGLARQDIATYMRFATFLGADESERLPGLAAVRTVGKFAGTGRALTSAFVQAKQSLTLVESRPTVFAQFKEVWAGIGSFPGFSPFDARTYFAEEIEPRLDNIENARQRSLDEARQAALDLWIEQSRLFGSVVLHLSAMAAPGTSSSEAPTPWDRFTSS